jgi:hypothetical protein
MEPKQSAQQQESELQSKENWETFSVLKSELKNIYRIGKNDLQDNSITITKIAEK